MSMVIKKTQWMCTGLLVALTSGTPAIADDTEILLIKPNSANSPKPNILFIIDSSGSMDDLVTTKLAYDSADPPYPANASCDPDRYYWTSVNSVPSCVAGNTQYFQKTSFVCAAAAARVTGIGSYTDTMVQYRSDGASSVAWQTLLPGESIGLVECQDDSSIHGAGGTATTEPYALKGSSMTAYTSDSTQEIDWTGNSVSDAVTVYDGNYLNYRATPVFVNKRKIDIVQEVSATVLNAVTNVNVGVMRFNDRDGGPVIKDIVDLDAAGNRASIIAAINGITADGATPLSETLYEAARFWRGMPAYYGQNFSEFPTDPGALRVPSPEAYEQPVMQSCTRNFNVLLTDGTPNEDFETPLLVNDMTNGLPNWSGALGRTDCTGTAEGDCLDDVAEYLFKGDISSTQTGLQNVTTHTIGFAINLPVMAQAAALSDGKYFLADDVESLTLALLKIVALVQDRSLSFAAPAVAVNSFNRTQNLNDLYLTTFAARGKIHWPGNLKKYRFAGGQIVDADGTAAINAGTGFFETGARSFWSATSDGIMVEAGGAANQLPAPGSRNIYTYNGSDANLIGGSNALTVLNSGAFTLADFGLTGAATEPTINQIIQWARGEDQADENGDLNLTEPRNQMGDPLHAQPAAVVYGGTAASPDTVIYTATNDGYVHAIEGATGNELWAFIPKEHLSSFSELFSNLDSTIKNYGVDGDIVPAIKDVDGDGIIETADGDFVYIIFGMRRGGGGYYALDVTNKTSPRLLWNFTNAAVSQSWSTPSIARIKMASGFGQNSDDAVVIVGGGYDVAHDTISHPASADGQGAGIFFLDLKSGATLWHASADTNAATTQLTLPKMTRAIPSAVRVIDLNGDRFADRMYASDMGGQIWRFDITNGKAPNGLLTDALVTGGVIAQLGAEGNTPTTDAETRRFYNSPDVSLFDDNAQNRRFIALSIGSGYRAHPLDNTTNERFYSIRDKLVFTSMDQVQYNAFTPIKESNLVDITGSVSTAIGAGDDGWLFRLPGNQKILSDSTTFNNEVFFVAFSPEPDNVAGTSCAAGVGRNFLYRVSVINGDPIGDLTSVVAGTEDSLRVTNLVQGGIAPSPRFLFPSPDPAVCAAGGECSPPPLGCIGVECFSPGFVNNPVRTLWTQDGIE